MSYETSYASILPARGIERPACKTFLFDQQLLEPNLWRYADCASPCAEVLSEYSLRVESISDDAALRSARSMSIYERK